LFLPFYDLGFIIVDEEHEQTFKQVDPAPRYHARDASIVLLIYIKQSAAWISNTVLKPILTPNLTNMVW
jgi:primosomal protein N'